MVGRGGGGVEGERRSPVGFICNAVFLYFYLVPPPAWAGSHSVHSRLQDDRTFLLVTSHISHLRSGSDQIRAFGFPREFNSEVTVKYAVRQLFFSARLDLLASRW